MIEIPLNSNPEQLFSVVLGNETYDCRVILNSRTGIWSISFAKDGIDIVNGIPLLGGIDIMYQYNIPITGLYVVNLNNNAQEASKTDLGVTTKLFILTEEELSDG